MSERQCCATCARKSARFPGGWWCNAVGRHVRDYEIDDYPPCGCARWMPGEERKEEEDGYGE